MLKSLNSVLKLHNLQPVIEWLRRIYQYRLMLSEMSTDLSQVRYFLVFIGNPRSGTTLFRSLLDAHVNICLGNEVNILDRMDKGESWRSIAGRIIQSTKNFSKKSTFRFG